MHQPHLPNSEPLQSLYDFRPESIGHGAVPEPSSLARPERPNNFAVLRHRKSVRAATSHLPDIGEVTHLARHMATIVVTVAEAAVVALAPSEELAVFGDCRAVSVA